MQTDQIINRLNNFRSSNLFLTHNYWSDIVRAERQICVIVHDVQNGVSRPSRLKTADKILIKWGF